MKFSNLGVLGIAVAVMSSISLAACGAATDVQSAGAPTSLALFDSTTTSVVTDIDADADAAPVTATTATTPEPGVASTDEQVNSSTVVPTTADQPATTTATTAAVDVNAPFCAAAVSILDLGTSVSLDDKTAAAVFFDQQAERWAAAVPVAPFAIVADVDIVSSFVDELRQLMVTNDYDLFAVFDDVTALEEELGSEEARIRADQFIHLTCDIEPERAVDATAVFYIGLLETADGQEQLAELLAAAEVFPLDGARCFVQRATPAAVYPLVDAASTADQDRALSDVLSACQLTIGATQ